MRLVIKYFGAKTYLSVILKKGERNGALFSNFNGFTAIIIAFVQKGNEDTLGVEECLK